MSDFLGDAGRNASSRMESMGVPNGLGDPMAGQGKQPMGDVNYRAAGSSTGGGGPLPGPEAGLPPEAAPIGPGAGGNCGSCANFDGQMSCALVAGNIDPMAVCDLFQPGQGAAPAGPPPGPVGGDEPQPATFAAGGGG